MKLTSRYLKIFLAITLLLNLVLAYKVIYYKYFRYNPDYTFNRKVLFNHLKLDSSSIVFVGNSLTQQFELAELFQNINVKNRGINGDNSTSILNRLSAVVSAKPKKIFIETGINDIIEGRSNEKILEDYKLILSKLLTECPSSKIYVQSILPVYEKGLAIRISPVKNENIRSINHALQMYCENNHLTFIDLNTVFDLYGEMNPKYCIEDGLHISGEGYLLMTKILKKYVNESPSQITRTSFSKK
ncbi:MAG: GDSL-type esterase/lipase family protein [Chitinophagaceae bacterium]